MGDDYVGDDAGGTATTTRTVSVTQLTLQRVVACRTVEKVTTFKPDSGGRFKVSVAAPPGRSAAVYRMATKVRPKPGSKKLVRTFTLPRAVDFR